MKTRIRELHRQQRRRSKLKKLKLKFLAARDSKEKNRLIEKIHRVHPFYEIPK